MCETTTNRCLTDPLALAKVPPAEMTDDEYRAAVAGNYRLMVYFARKHANDLDPEDVAQELCADLLRRVKCRTRVHPFEVVVRMEVRVAAQRLRNRYRTWLKSAKPAGCLSTAASCDPAAGDELPGIPPEVLHVLAKLKRPTRAAVGRFLKGEMLTHLEARRVGRAAQTVRATLGLPTPEPYRPSLRYEPRIAGRLTGPLPA